MIVITAIADPAPLLLTLDALIDLDDSDELTAQAHATVDRIRRCLPDDSMRAHFDASEVVQRVGSRDQTVMRPQTRILCSWRIRITV
jgi:hypothetical protein